VQFVRGAEACYLSGMWNMRVSAMTEDKSGDPTKAPEFQRVLKNLLTTPHKTQSEVRKDRAAQKPARKPKAAKGKA
jgi:hypothetical protein